MRYMGKAHECHASLATNVGQICMSLSLHTVGMVSSTLPTMLWSALCLLFW